MNIYEYAMKMELDGKKYYTELMETAENRGVKVIFNIMAQEEQSHYDILKGLMNNIELKSESTVLDVAKNVFELMFDNTDKVSTTISQDALFHVLKLEKESIRFYEEQSEKAESNLEKKVFEKLVVEEKKHYTLIENLLDHISGGLINGIVSAEFQQLGEDDL